MPGGIVMGSRVIKGMQKGFVLLIGSALAVAAGCDDTPYTDASTCHQGDTRECVGPGACKGAQECLPTGLGFASCECADDGTPNGGGGEAGTASQAGAGSDAVGGMQTNPGGAPGAGGVGEPMVDGGAAGAGGAGGAGEPHFECTPFGNVGCPAAQNCSPDLGEPHCVNAGSKAQLATCDQTSECAPGLTCIFRNCVKACAKTADCGTADASIKCGLGYTHPDLGPISGCFKDCDVLSQNCPVGQACYLGSCVTPLSGAVGQGEACNVATQCAKGLECLADLDQDGQTDCSKYCSTSASAPCGEGLTCYPLSEGFPKIPASWGLCITE
jgi:hypothetical protein